LNLLRHLKAGRKNLLLIILSFSELCQRVKRQRLSGDSCSDHYHRFGANYRAACRARSQAEFHSKLSIVVEEADESAFWMEILVEAEIVKPGELNYLSDEANQILKIVAASRKTVVKKVNRS